MPAFEWVHVQLHQQKGMISLSPPTICNSAVSRPGQLANVAGIAPAKIEKQKYQQDSLKGSPQNSEKIVR
ncbi:hypothetical protein [Shigella flexneri]|nr:hypothetical protein [Shigella flexneri]UMU65692.1 hypothetical protein HZT26_23930 [Shigella flexneri]